MRVVQRGLLVLVLAASPPAFTPVIAGAVPSAAPDYSDPSLWFCRPGRATDVCGRSDQDATVVEADGTRRIEHFHPAYDPPIDCFYVYPTVSLDPGGNASLIEETQEVAVVNQQFARFASVCRPYALLYRQVTLTALRANLAGIRSWWIGIWPMPT